MISKLVEMTRLLSQFFSGSPGADPQTCSRMAGEVHEQSRILTNALLSLRVEEQLISKLIRFPFLLERVGHVLEIGLDRQRTRALAHVTFGDKAHREQEQIFVLLLDILTNLRDALQNPSREALLAVLFQGKRLEGIVRQFTGTHWHCVKPGACQGETLTMWCEILDSVKLANEYLMEMAVNLLDLGKSHGLDADGDQTGSLSS